MSNHDVLGFLASSLVLTSFWMRGMLSLRVVAIASNIVFITYGHVAHILPVLTLHLILLPVNLWRVVPMLRGAFAARVERDAERCAHRGRQGRRDGSHGRWRRFLRPTLDLRPRNALR